MMANNTIINEEELGLNLGLQDSEDGVYFWGINLADEKEFKKFIKSTETVCRKTIEYDMWQKKTKINASAQNEDPQRDDSLNCPHCGISYELVRSESHHHPITLWNIVVGIFQDWVDNDRLDEKTPLDLVVETMELHTKDRVACVVLCKHCHEKFHSRVEDVYEHVNKISDYLYEQKKLKAEQQEADYIDRKQQFRKENKAHNMEVKQTLYMDDGFQIAPSKDVGNLDVMLNDARREMLEMVGVPEHLITGEMAAKNPPPDYDDRDKWLNQGKPNPEDFVDLNDAPPVPTATENWHDVKDIDNVGSVAIELDTNEKGGYEQ